MKRIKLVVGDWSNDGHNQSDTFYIRSNKTAEEIEAAIPKAMDLTGMSFKGGDPKKYYQVACDYEDSYIPAKVLNKLKDKGIEFPYDKLENEPDAEGSVCLVPDDFVEVWCWFVKLGDPSIEIKIENTSIPTIYPGGYGLYFN